MSLITAKATAAPTRRRGFAAAIPGATELMAVLLAIGMLLPLFDRVAASAPGRDGRFGADRFELGALPESVLAPVCDAVGWAAEPELAAQFCRHAERRPPLAPSLRMPLPLQDAIAQAAKAFDAPVRAAQSRLAALRQQQKDEGADVRDIADAIADAEAEIEPLMTHFRLAADRSGPLPLRCASRWVEAALVDHGAAAPRNVASTAQPDAATAARANAVLLLAAALDGRTATGVAGQPALPPAPARPAAECTGSADTWLSGTAALSAEARRLQTDARKDAAMLDLLAAAGPQWAVAMLLGYAFLVASRRGLRASVGIGLALCAWAAAAWLARVPWPLGGSHGFTLARVDADLTSRPAAFVIALAAAGVALLLVALASTPAREQRDARAQALSSRFGYAGLVLATGLGALVLLDLSATGNPVNRYLALYHQGHLWFGMLVFSSLVFLRRPIARGLGWTLAVAGEAGRRLAARVGGPIATVALLTATAVALLAFGLGLANMRQLTSELGKLWLIVGAAWFFFLRAGPLTERLARASAAGTSLWRYVWPLAFVVAVLIGAMLVTRDMGPLLIAGYASGAFLAASFAMWSHQRSGRSTLAPLLAVALFGVWIGAITLALFRLGAVDGVTAVRLESLAAPFASTNDQLALVTWFQRAAPPDGFGLGAVPWCGYAGAGRCNGVPAQIHSDYTFTAIVGIFGSLAAWSAALGCAVWLHRLVRHHGRVTRGEPRLVGGIERVGHDGQALLSWICVAWVVLAMCQLAITVAGNLAVLPLTGVTFPFVSFGMTSLLVNLGFLALCLNVDLPSRSPHG